MVQKWTTILLFAYYRNFVKLGRFLANTRNKILRQSQGRDANTTPLPLVLLISSQESSSRCPPSTTHMRKRRSEEPLPKNQVNLTIFFLGFLNWITLISFGEVLIYWNMSPLADVQVMVSFSKQGFQYFDD